ncbi:hypothetical protein Salat_2044100 [Sesamum alatum]|uniref:Mitochondrial transcription termination factor family protein n=1 Tax=Sesamum alatum TaxID=300844 RepID=A0AAE2CG37_9LAMI|nr:hypothetical protein Salat_2044100 [Sesamum alatum]
MLSVLCRKQLIVPLSNARVYGIPRFLVAGKDGIFVRLFSSKRFEIEADDKQSFTVSYLMNSCGLSSEAAISASKKLHLNSPEKPDRLLALLKSYGFSNAHISKMMAKCPIILTADPEKTVSPKLKFFHSIGVPAPVLARVLSISPHILRYSLQKKIIPVYINLKRLLQTNERIVHFIKRTDGNYHFIYGVLKYIHSNVAMLRKYGLRESDISFLFSHYPNILIIETDRLAALLDRVTEFGLDTKKHAFVHAMEVLFSISKSNWEHKKEVYRRWGWSESDIRRAFSIHPKCMTLSEKKIMSTMEFLVNEMSFQPSDIARYPVVICYNLEKRIKPRCQVAKVLLLKKLIKKSYSLTSLVVIPERLFLLRCVTKYQGKIPLLDLYHGNLSLVDFGSKCEDPT